MAFVSDGVKPSSKQKDNKRIIKMEALTLWSAIGFLLAAYAVIANDSVQTLGTWIASNNEKFNWKINFFTWQKANLRNGTITFQLRHWHTLSNIIIIQRSTKAVKSIDNAENLLYRIVIRTCTCKFWLIIWFPVNLFKRRLMQNFSFIKSFSPYWTWFLW